MANESATLKGQGFTFEGCGVQAGKYPHVGFIKRDDANEQIAFDIRIGKPPGE